MSNCAHRSQLCLKQAPFSLPELLAMPSAPVTAEDHSQFPSTGADVGTLSSEYVDERDSRKCSSLSSRHDSKLVKGGHIKLIPFLPTEAEQQIYYPS